MSVAMKHSEPELNEAFRRVRNPQDWEGPIAAVILEPNAETRELIAEAVKFYTGTEAEFQLLHGYTYRVRAVGYRAGPEGT